MGLRLIIEDYDGETTVVPLNGDEGTVTVGRQESNTIQLTEQNVSRRHAKFNFDGHHWLVEDLSSYNGVRVNGRQVPASTQLDEGDVVQIGDYRLILGSDVKAGDHQINTQRNRAANDDTVIGLSTKTAIVPGEPTRNLTVEQVPSITTEVRSVASPRVNTPVTEIVVDEPEPQAKKRGLWVVIVALVVLVGIAGVALVASSPSDEPAPTGEAKASLPTPAEPPRTTPAPPAKATTPVAQPSVQAGIDTSAETKSTAASADPTSSDAKAPGRSADAAPASSAHQPNDSPSPNETAKPSGESPANPDELAVDPEAGGKPQRNPARAAAELRLAQEASFAQDFEKARDLARRSYEHNFSADALRILGLSACKLNSRKDARWAYDKLRLNFRSERAEQIRSDLQQVCASHGINLGP